MPMQDCQPRLEKVLADQGYSGKLVEAVKNVLGWEVEILEKQNKGFVVEWKCGLWSEHLPG
jgi:hypothetical protein